MKSKGIIRWVLGALLCCGISLHAQTITLSTSSTPSPCYNEGTLTVSISGGTGPYTASIIAGPAGPNLSYPITLPPGGTTFSNLPHGTYTIKVVDATGASATVTGVVGGTYQFPIVTASPAGTTAIASVVSGTGVGPYQFAISSSGPNSGFGAYQSSGTFNNLCPGTYWIRVLDACGNIYTTSVTIAYTLTYQVQCISFTNGTLTVTASGGNGPYTYSISGQTNTTGVFTGVTLTGRTLTITDACGVREVIPMLPGGATFKIHCPFDNDIYLNSFADAFNISPGNVTYICTNCTPIQTVTNPGSSPVIQQVTLGHTYDIEIVLSSCGGDTIRTVYTPIQSPGHITSDFTGCNSFVAQLYNSNNVLVPNVDSFILETPSHQIIAENNTGIFTHLPDGLYLIVAISRAACVGQTSTYVNVPHLQTSCSLMMKDASCQTQWEFVLDSVSGDNYTMVYAPGDTIAGRRSDDGSQPVIEFYGLAGGQYTLISDSGCDWSLYFDSISAPGAITSSTTTCGGQKYISIQDTSQSGCNLLYAKIYYGDSLIYRGVPVPSIPMVFSVPDSGWYYYKYYVIPDPGDSSAVVYYDSVCPRDSGAIYVGYGTLPYPYSSSLYSCAGGARPQYSIYGGSIPYTVEIPGFDTIVLRTNTATFPTDSPGTYTVIAFDSCGISHSFAFVIIDTCTPVVCATLSARGDTTICSGQRVLLTSAPSSGGGAYSWSPGGGTTEDILVTPSATTSYVVTYQQSRCPAVSDTILVTVTQGPSVQVDDTVLCTGQSATLSATAGPPGGTFSWSPGGASTSSITIAPLSDTMYTISYQIPGCPPAVDTSMVSLRPLPGAAIATQPAICYTSGGMAIALATGGTAPYTYQWSDTTHATTDTLPGLYPGKTYTVTVYDIYHCSISTSAQIPDSIVPLGVTVDSVAEVSCYGLHDGYIALSILGSSHISYQWSPGSGDSIRSGLAAGLYSLTATDPAGCADTLSLTLTQPVQVTLAASPADTLICLGQHVLLTATASAAGGVYSWMPGGSGSQDTLVNPAATSAYIITYTTPQCPPLSDTLHVQVAIPPTLSTIDTDLCAGQPVTLTATTSPSGGSYAWSPGGGSTQSITVSPQTSSIYTVTYIIAGCPPVVDSSSVTISPLPAVAVSTHYAVCYDPDGMAIALPSSGTAPYTYQWSDAAHTTTDTLSGLYYGASYTVTVSDLHHCTASASALIPDSIEPLQIMLDSLADVSCYGMSDGYLSLTVTNSTHISYQWSPVSGDSILSGLPAGQYSLTATDPAGCMDTMSFTITQPPAEVLSITPADSLLREGDSLLLLPALTPYPGGSLTYDWSPSIGLSCTDCAQPTFLSTAGQYHYTLVITYHGGMCQISDTVSVRVYSAHLIYVPNAFTPNGDGVNDSYQVFPIGFRYFDLMIFDRWGEKVFESLDQQRGWDGRYLGDLQSPGIYTYVLDVTFDDGYTVHNKGSITLIR